MCGSDTANTRDKQDFLYADLSGVFLGLHASAELRKLRIEPEEPHTLRITVTVSSRFRI